ncbi:YbdD/YjiX family protein [Corynebacterium striatum]|nr:YbdD/YjiX family protein [Corynebacterium striatum]HCG2989439.1 YbdD/YjiX family protein [Corynebacterium striatum]HCG3145776.1 YbdD/YjiX family protein [Corynebacterium striatum]HCG3167059.1 YbdD/YjiX family protein [Corynebacterium striatum]
MITALKKISWYFGELMGDHAYAKYCDHLRAHHPGAEIPTEREYWRARYAEQDADPGARCC